VTGRAERQPVWIPRELHRKLHALADERELSVTYFVSKLLEEALDALEPATELRLTRKP
jgi:hypothetical protein